MMPLPKTVGPLTVLRQLGVDGVCEIYEGRLDSEGGRRVVVRRILPHILRDEPRLRSVESRVRDLLAVRHPSLAQVREWLVDGDDRYVIEDRAEGVELLAVLERCRANGTRIPENVFLNLATQVCNGLEALHGRPGKASGTDSVLHLGLTPTSIILTRDGKVVLGTYAMTRSPSLSPADDGSSINMEYLSPEQTHPDQRVTPAGDIFSLGTILYEALTLDPLFRAESNLQTIHKVRRAEVTTQLLKVKERMPGLDKVLYRALSLNPRHRYQRAFVLREDLRGLMAGYSFATINEDTRSFLEPLFGPAGAAAPATTVAQAPDAFEQSKDFEEPVSTRIDPDPMSTAAHAAAALADRVARQRAGRLERESTAADTLPVKGEDPEPPTELYQDGGRKTEPFIEDPPRPTTPDIPVVLPPARDVDPNSTRGFLVHGAPDDGEGTDPATQVSEANRAAPAPMIMGLPPGTPAAVDPNSTRGFIAGHMPKSPVAPSVAPPARPQVAPPPVVKPAAIRPTPPAPIAPLPPVRPFAPPSSEFNDETTENRNADSLLAAAEPAHSAPPARPAPAAPAPRIVAAVPAPARPEPSPPKPVVAGPAPVVAPSGPTTSRPMPPPSPRPAPEARPAPDEPKATSSEEDFSDLEYQPRRSGLLLFAVPVLIFALIVLCAVGAYASIDVLGGMMGSSDADVTQTDAAPATDAAQDAATGQEEQAEQDAAETLATDAGAGTSDDQEPDAGTADSAVASPTGASSSASTSSPYSRGGSSDHDSSSYRSSSYGGSSYGSSSQASSSSSASSPRTASSRSGSATSRSSTSSGRSDDDVSDILGDDAIVDASLDAPEDMDSLEATNLDKYAATASQGKLTSSDVMYLEMVELEDPSFTRSRALLLMNAQRKGDTSGTKRYLDQLMQLPENQYNPVYLTDYGRYYANEGDYSKALAKVNKAERYWSRLPSSLVFTKKAEIYEIQAASYQGLFYQSGDDLELLDQAVRHWEKYRNHVDTKSRSDLSRRADKEIAKLEDIRVRLQ